MRSDALAALLLLLASAARGLEEARPTLAADDGPDPDRDADRDDDGDSAPFTVTVERADGGRCGGVLLALREVLTAADCAAGRGLRVAGAAVAGVARAERAPLALLRLAEAAAGGARPIVLGAEAECEAPSAACYAVSVRRAPRLRVLDVARAACPAGAAPGALCFGGPTLCAADRGAGVVCSGKLCGVLTSSFPSSAAGDSCGAAHVAHPVARARRFLECATAPGPCGRDGDAECAKECTEESSADGGSPARSSPGAPSSAPPSTEGVTPRRTAAVQELRPGPTPRAPDPGPATATRTSPDAAAGASMSLWEPNRPDFKKAGEYGDNAADYGGEEAAAPPKAGPPSDAPPPTTSTRALSSPLSSPLSPPLEDPDDDSDVKMLSSAAAHPRLSALYPTSILIVAIKPLVY